MSNNEPETKNDAAMKALNKKRQQLTTERQQKLLEVKKIDEEIDQIIESMYELSANDTLVNALTGDPLENDWNPVKEMGLLYEEDDE